MFDAESSPDSNKLLGMKMNVFFYESQWNRVNEPRNDTALAILNRVFNLAGVTINDKKSPHTELRHEYLIFTVADVSASCC